MSYTLEKRGDIVEKKRYWSHDEALITILLVSSERSQQDESNDTKKGNNNDPSGSHLPSKKVDHLSLLDGKYDTLILSLVSFLSFIRFILLKFF